MTPFSFFPLSSFLQTLSTYLCPDLPSFPFCLPPESFASPPPPLPSSSSSPSPLHPHNPSQPSPLIYPPLIYPPLSFFLSRLVYDGK